MSFWDNVKKFAQPYSDEDYDEYEEENEVYEDEVQEPARRRRTVRSPSRPGGSGCCYGGSPTWSAISYPLCRGRSRSGS